MRPELSPSVYITPRGVLKFEIRKSHPTYAGAMITIGGVREIIVKAEKHLVFTSYKQSSC